MRVTVLEQMMKDGKGEGFFFLSIFGKKLRRKLEGTKELKKERTKENENDDSSSTDITDLALVRGLDRCFRSGGVDNER